jgi:two-component system, cell cycle sensor histidine kinase and response regulator CckA
MAGARLLLVDDEPALLELLKTYLERLGYHVDAQSDPQQAIDVFEADPKRYALVMTDLTLPGINGEEMLNRMRARNPNLRAIVSSGYPYEPRGKQIVFLQKPYVPKMLADAIEGLLKNAG